MARAAYRMEHGEGRMQQSEWFSGVAEVRSRAVNPKAALAEVSSKEVTSTSRQTGM